DVLETTHGILREATTVHEITDELDPAFGQIRGSSRAMLLAKHAAQRMARADFPVLIVGESGTGKELFAEAIHKASGRRGKPFVPVNCGGLDHEIVDSELFGHARGAFTGAKAERPGKFEAAKGGTIFLDELGTLPLRTQARLLRVLQDGLVVRMGENIVRKVDARVITATNADLWAAIAARTFREDLYHRVAVLPLTLPPLTERGSDLGELAAHFLDETCGQLQVTRTFSEDAVAQLYRYPWRGNVRELQSVIRRLVVLCAENEISGSHIEALLGRSPAGPARFSEQTDSQFLTQLAATMDELLLRYQSRRGLPRPPEERDLIGEILKPLIFGRALKLRDGDKEAAGGMFKDGKLDTSPTRDGPKVETYTKLFQPRIDEQTVVRLRGQVPRVQS
ncbi:MAG: sigma 54-interacting transcriptional regulator, partial [Planctomycetota bacterium]